VKVYNFDSLYNIIIQYKQTKCSFSKLIFKFTENKISKDNILVFNFDAFYMFRTPGFLFGKAAVYTGMVPGC
jgi:hypothetical protein